jgi:hypothetical protein
VCSRFYHVLKVQPHWMNAQLSEDTQDVEHSGLKNVNLKKIAIYSLLFLTMAFIQK